MKNQEVIALVNNGALVITNYTLEPAHAYKVFKFKKSLREAFENVTAQEKELPKEAGIENPAEFDEEFKRLREVQNPNDDEKKALDDCIAKYNKFVQLRQALLEDEVELDCKKLPYVEWFKLRQENKAVKFNGTEIEVFPDWVEAILEDVLWEEPND